MTTAIAMTTTTTANATTSISNRGVKADCHPAGVAPKDPAKCPWTPRSNARGVTPLFRISAKQEGKMIRRKNLYSGNTYIWTTALGLLLSQPLSARHFFPCSPEELEAAIVQANVNCEDDVIDLQCNQFDLTTSDNSTPTNGSNGLPVIGPDSGHKLKIKNGTISRSAAPETPEFRFFEIASDAILILEEVVLENGVVVTGSGIAVNGGAILNQGSLELVESTIVGFVPPNTVQFNAASGGGLYNDAGATAKIKGSTFSGLQATTGGAAYNVDNIHEICSSRFVNNVATGDDSANTVGGAIFNQAGANIGIVRRSIFDQNQAGNSLS